MTHQADQLAGALHPGTDPHPAEAAEGAPREGRPRKLIYLSRYENTLRVPIHH